MARKGRKTAAEGGDDATLRTRREVCRPDTCGLERDGDFQSRSRGTVPLWSCTVCGYSTLGEEEAMRLNPDLKAAA